MSNDGIEVIIELVIDLVPRYFGAFLKWIYLKFKVPFTTILEQKGTTRIGYVSLGIIFLMFLLIFNFK
jgi:hypothetical protein